MVNKVFDKDEREKITTQSHIIEFSRGVLVISIESTMNKIDI